MLPEEIIMQIAVGYSFRPNALPNRETRRVQGKWPSFLTNREGLHDASVPTTPYLADIANAPACERNCVSLVLKLQWPSRCIRP
jgi:hypothetical protein